MDNNNDLSFKVVPVEVKTRVGAGFLASARQIVWDNTPDEDYELGGLAYLSIESNDLTTWAPDRKEWSQLLHHAYSYRTNEACFLLGTTCPTM